jgi:transposase
VTPRWTAGQRRGARARGKSDTLDARAIAEVVRRDGARLPRLAADDATAVLDLLAREREEALADATRLRNQLHAHLRQLDPHYARRLPKLTTVAGVAAARLYQTPSAADLDQQRAAAVRRLAGRLQGALDQIAELTAQLDARAEAGFSPLTALAGVGTLTAGTLAGILGCGMRFTSEAPLAAYAGVAPLEASSAGGVRHRLNRGGNRRLNAVVHRIALTQARCDPAAKAYLARRRAAGKTPREAVRALKRFIVRAIWRHWQDCPPAVGQAARPAGRAA